VQYSDFVLPLPGRYLYFDVNHQSYPQEGLDQVTREEGRKGGREGGRERGVGSILQGPP
jgi:hypothetical protein